MVQSANKDTEINCRAIFWGACIALGFLFTIGALAFALSTAMGPSKGGLPSLLVFGIMLFFLIIVLVIAYFLAAFIAARVSRPSSQFLSLLHALSSWSILSILIMTCVIAALAINSIIALESPLVLMDLHLKKPNVVTKVIPEKSKDNLFRKEHDNEVRLALVAWAAFLSIALGAGASCAASHIAYKRSNKVNRSQIF